MESLVLSLFPGLDLLGHAFAQEGFCVVRGPDLLWGQDVREFHPMRGRFDGVIGGPPCQKFSPMAAISKSKGKDCGEDLVPEFERCVWEAWPQWFLMENVPRAPVPQVEDYGVHDFLLSPRWVGEAQNRPRRFSFGLRGVTEPADLREKIEFVTLEDPRWRCCVMASGGVKPGTEGRRGQSYKGFGYQSWAGLRRILPDQGLPETFMDECPFTLKAAWRMIGNGVPVSMGRPLAAGIKKMLDELLGQAEEEKGDE